MPRLMRISAVLLIANALGAGSGRASFEIEVIDAAGDAGAASSVALDANHAPHVVYTRVGAACPPFVDSRRIAVAHKEGGVWVIEVVPNAHCLANNPSIAIDSNGEPRLLFNGIQFDIHSNVWTVDLVYAVPNGGSWDFEVIETNQEAGGNIPSFNDPRFALDAADVPHVSYGDDNPTTLKYAVRIGGTWNIEVVDATDQAGGYTDLGLDPDGNPCISYFAYTGNVLRFAHKSGGDWMIEDIESSIDLFGCTSLQIDSNAVPHLAYARPSGGLVYATKVDGTWARTQVPVVQGFPAAEVELALDSRENPHIIFQDRATEELRYVLFTGNEWLLEEVDSVAVGDHTAIAVDPQDRAHVTYYESVNQDLRYATGLVLADAPSVLDPLPGPRVALYPNPSRGPMTLTVEPGEGGGATALAYRAAVVVVDVSGRRLLSLTAGIIEGPSLCFLWDARNGLGRGLAAGSYLVDVMLDGKRVASRRWTYLP